MCTCLEPIWRHGLQSGRRELNEVEADDCVGSGSWCGPKQLLAGQEAGRFAGGATKTMTRMLEATPVLGHSGCDAAQPGPSGPGPAARCREPVTGSRGHAAAARLPASPLIRRPGPGTLRSCARIELYSESTAAAAAPAGYSPWFGRNFWQVGTQ